MAKMLAAAHYDYGGPKASCGCCFAKPGARAAEKREWLAEAQADLAAEEDAHEFNMNNAVGILFGDVAPK